jgi:uncharacterized cupin superfamily protein
MSCSRNWAKGFMLIALLGGAPMTPAGAAPLAQKVRPADAPMKSLPITPKDVVSGNPVATAHVMHSEPDGKYATGIWACTTGTFHWTFGQDEFIYVVEGEAVITYDSGQKIAIRGGDVVYFPKGPTTWHILKPIKKVFAVRD